MSKLSIHHPQAISARGEALALLKHSTNRIPPDLWLDVLLDRSENRNRELNEGEARRIRLLGDLLREMNGSDPDWLLDKILASEPELTPRIAALRTQLVERFEIREVDEKPIFANPEMIPVQPRQNDSIGFGDPKWEAQFLAHCKIVGIPAALKAVVADLIATSSESSGASARRVSAFLENIAAADRPEHGYEPGDYSSAGSRFREVAEIVFNELFAKLPSDQSSADGSLHWAIQNFALMAFEGRRAEASEEVSKRLRAMGALGLARIRGKIKDAVKQGADVKSVWESSWLEFEQNARVVLTFGGLGYALGQFVQLLRVFPLPAVGSSLAYWGDEGRALGVLTLVPTYLVNSIHLYSDGYAVGDPSLRRVREDLAEFCLGRIGQKKGNVTKGMVATVDSLVERDPHWRACYLYAVDSLRVNPAGRGHEKVFWAQTYDPDPRIREIAAQLYAGIEKNREIANGSSPRRPLITAIWWLFQAHRLSLGLPVEEESIHATLATLVRRTTEKRRPQTTTKTWQFAGPARRSSISEHEAETINETSKS